MKWILIALVILSVALVACSGSNSTQEEANTINLGGSSTDNNDVVDEPTIVSPDDLSAHNSEDDCWVVYDGEVYDITDYVPKHPGGKEQIIPHCGTSDDFVNAFTDQHGTSKVSKLKSVGFLQGTY